MRRWAVRGVPQELLRRAAAPVALGHTRPSHGYPPHRKPFGRSQPAPQGLWCLSTEVVRSALLALARLAAAQPASEGSQTGSPPTAMQASPTLAVAPKLRSVLAMQLPHRLLHGDARVGRQDVPKWPTLRRRPPPAGPLSPSVLKASSARRVRRDYQSTPMVLKDGISVLDELPWRRPAIDRMSPQAARPTLGIVIVYRAQREQPKRIPVKL